MPSQKLTKTVPTFTCPPHFLSYVVVATLDVYVNMNRCMADWSAPAAQNITAQTGVGCNVITPVADDDTQLIMLLNSSVAAMLSVQAAGGVPDAKKEPFHGREGPEGASLPGKAGKRFDVTGRNRRRAPARRGESPAAASAPPPRPEYACLRR